MTRPNWHSVDNPHPPSSWSAPTNNGHRAADTDASRQTDQPSLPEGTPELVERHRGVPLRIWLRAYRRTLLQLLGALGVIGFMILLAAQISLGNPTTVTTEGATSEQPSDAPAAAPTPQLTTPVVLLEGAGVSEFAGAGGLYTVEVFDLVVEPAQFRLSFRASGPTDMFSPGTACVEGTPSAQAVRAPAIQLVVDEPGRWEGTYTFPIAGSGTYSFEYGCHFGYSQVPLFSI